MEREFFVEEAQAVMGVFIAALLAAPAGALIHFYMSCKAAAEIGEEARRAYAIEERGPLAVQGIYVLVCIHRDLLQTHIQSETTGWRRKNCLLATT